MIATEISQLATQSVPKKLPVAVEVRISDWNI
jgi:hypothetical protein